MEKRTAVLIAVCNEAFCAGIAESLQNMGCQVVGAVADGLAAIEQISALRPDVVVLDLSLSKADGLSVLRALPKEARPKTLLLSAHALDSDALAAEESGAVSLLLKPCSAQTVGKRVREILEANLAPGPCTCAEPDVADMVTDVIHKIGVPSYSNGFQYLQKMILLAMQDEELMNVMTKLLYPKVAEAFCTTPARVERAVRHTIEAAWGQGDPDTMRRFFGYAVSDGGVKPTNGEFISQIANRLQYRLRCENQKNKG